MNIINQYKEKYYKHKRETLSLESYLKLAKKDPSVYASPAERMLKAIGEPEIIDTSKTPELSRIFGNRLIKQYKAFKDFYGMEDVINNIVSYFKHSAQGLEESRQVLYLVGPVGSAKSSLAEKLKKLIEQEPIYVLKGSPIFESPLGLFEPEESDNLGIPKRYLEIKPSPWAVKRLEEFEGDISKFEVQKIYPNQLSQIAICKTEPGDENCLTGDHEYLTPNGWKNIASYSTGDKVAQYTEDGKIEFVIPTDYVTGISNKIIHFKNKNLSLSVTPSHRMIYQTRGRNGAPVTVKYHNAGEGQFSSAFAIQSGIGGQEGINLTEAELRLQVAIAADGSFRNDNITTRCTIQIFKERKKDRLETLLQAAKIEYKTSDVKNRPGYVEYVFYAPERNKNLASYFKANHEQLKIICDEVTRWDGHIKSEDRSAFFTTKKDEADFVQYAHTMTGKRATISVRKQNNEKHKDLYIVNINKSTTRPNYGEITPTTETGAFPVFCFNVPSTMFLTRKDGIVTVTGNNQDISALVGKLDIRQLEFFPQNDPDAYSYSGGLCLANQGVLEFVEMFKAPIKVLHPLLTATQERNYKGTESIGAIPFDGIILAHSNEAEWDVFKNNKNNEAFIDRVYTVKVPYCKRVREEIKIYKKLLSSSSLVNSPCAPHTLRLLAEFCVLTRIDRPKNSSIFAKMKAYDGQNVKEQMADAKSVQEYEEGASRKECFYGISTRQAFKILSKVFNYDKEEIAANPVHLLTVLEDTVHELALSDELESTYLAYVKEYLKENYAEQVGKDIQTAYLDSYSDYGQALFNRYLIYADYWQQDIDYRDPDTGQLLDREELNRYLESVEKPAGIGNPKDFRHEVTNFVLRYRAKHNDQNPKWTSYEKLKTVIEANMFSKTKDLLPVISFVGHKDKESAKKHTDFVDRMKELGYTERQVKTVTEWHERVSKE